MERALAVVEGDEAAKDLVREAGELAAATDAELLLVHVTTDEEWAELREDLEEIPELASSYSIGHALEGAQEFAEDIGEEVLADVDIQWRAVGRLGGKAEQILALAAEEDCDHVFMTGAQRSPAGKAVFGDATQSVILKFDGAVTVVTA